MAGKPFRAAALVVAFAFFAVLVLLAQTARAQPLVVDLSRHLVAITTDFTGADVLMFGAVDGPGDVIMVVRGPVGETQVRRKDRIAGIWVNSAEMRFTNVPGYYGVWTSRPLEGVAARSVLARHQIGIPHLNLIPDPERAHDPHMPDFRASLVRLKQREGLFGDEVGRITRLGERLFRADLSFPANVPVGTYSVEIYLVRDGEVVSAEITPLAVSKIGIGAEIYDFAHSHSAIYGITAIFVAVFAGWLASVAFRKT